MAQFDNAVTRRARPYAAYSVVSLHWIAATTLMLAALLAPALLNGFPLIFPDTGGYLLRPIEGTLGMGRSALYGALLYAGIPWAFWPVVGLQALLTVWTIALTLRVNGRGGRPWLTAVIVVALSAGTSLPWFASQLMPDIFFPLSVLAIYLLAFHGRALRATEQAALVALVAVAMASHMAALGVCAAVVAALAMVRAFSRERLPALRIAVAGLAVVSGIALAPLSNLAIAKTFAFTPGGSSFLFGRLIEDGIIARYLDEKCPDPGLRICRYSADLATDADGWLWGNDTPYYKLGGVEGFKDEERRIITDTLKLYPLAHVVTAARATLKQFFAFRTEVSINKWYNSPTTDMFKDHLPELYPALMRARQQVAPPDPDILNVVHLPVAIAALGALTALIVFHRPWAIAPSAFALAITLVLALAANAAICGIFSHPVDRYQSRLILLAPLAVIVAWLSRSAGHRAANRRNRRHAS